MLKNLLLLVFVVFSTNLAHASETGIAKSNLQGWQGISLWCESDSPNIHQSNYICSQFYGEFSKRAKAYGVPFAYVQTEGKQTAEWLYQNNWFPISVEMIQVAPETTEAKVVVDLLENRKIRLYESTISLKGSPLKYGHRLQEFYRDLATRFVRDFESKKVGVLSK